MRTALFLSACGCVAFALLGCNLSQPYPAKDTFVLRSDEVPRAGARVDATVRVEGVRIAPPFDGRSLVSRTGDVSFDRDYYNIFIAPPDELATAELIRLLLESGAFAGVFGVASGAPADMRLECTVTDLYADMRVPANRVGVCRARYRLLKEQAGSVSVVGDWTREGREPIESDSGEAIARALGRAFGETVQGFVESAGGTR